MIVCPKIARPCDCVNFTLTITNTGTTDAVNVILTGLQSYGIFGVSYSLDGGQSWQPWQNNLQLGIIPADTQETLYIRGTVSRCISGCIETLAELSYTSLTSEQFTKYAICKLPVVRRSSAGNFLLM
jgi:uncharacterized repeat protein (TIGR01451 family)